MVVVADRQVDRSVVPLRCLGHAEGGEIVVLRPFDVGGFQRQVPELEHLRIELPLHCAFLLISSSNDGLLWLAMTCLRPERTHDRLSGRSRGQVRSSHPIRITATHLLKET